MHAQGTSVVGHPDSRVTGPAVDGPLWFDTDDRPVRLLMNVPLSLDLMAAALYGAPGLTPRDLDAAEDARGHIAVSVASDGLTPLERRANELAGPGAADKPGWLAFRRQRATDVMAAAHGAPAARTADMEMEAG